MKTIVTDKKLVSFCGLYCGACKSYLKGKCPGCRENAKASWCKVRSCCLENKYDGCAVCATYADPKDCGRHNNFIARIFGLIFQSDRRAGVLRIRQIGLDGFAKEMAEKGCPAIRRS